VRLRAASELHEQAQDILQAERTRLLPAIPGAELHLTGATSLPGAQTKGDVDLHLRVPRSGFTAAVAELSGRYRIVHRDIWTDGFATFELDDYGLPVGIALTAIGDEHDELFIRTWQRIAADPAALAGYNAMKRRSATGEDAGYEAAKSAFFAELLRET
jgi:GrpB-like predicted nucleotidyltransferase (UPF0157 family)